MEGGRHLAGSGKYTVNKILMNKETKTHQAKHFVTHVPVCLREGRWVTANTKEGGHFLVGTQDGQGLP